MAECNFKEESVLIGVVDGFIEDVTKVSWDMNKIGGFPNWMVESVSPPVCHTCQNALTLVAQLYCPLDGSPYHRTVYIFTCISRICQQNSFSFQVFRAQRLADVTQQREKPTSSHQTKEPAVGCTPSDWCNDADDWGENANDWSSADDTRERVDGSTADQSVTSSIDSSALTGSVTVSESVITTSSSLPDGLACDVGKLSLQDDRIPPVHQTMSSSSGSMQTQPQPSSFENEVVVPHFVQYYISVFDEPTPPLNDALSYELQLLKEYQRREGVCLTDWQENMECQSSARGGNGSKEGYEKATAKHGDRAFHKFAKKIQLCPQQCIRYSYNGSPLWLTALTPEQGSVPICQYCSSRRRYEFQLMPALLPYLQLQEQKGSPIEFGVVVVYTCSQSCWSDGTSDFYREEVAIIQHDPDSAAVSQAQQKLRKLPQTR